MAEKRMFAKSIVLSDAFLDMPASARSLYFTLGMCADDDGFVSAPKSIMRQCGASQDDLAILVTKRFILTFDSGVIVIKHWRINNTLKNDRHRPTEHQEELAQLAVKANKAYTERAKLPPTDGAFPPPEPSPPSSETSPEPTWIQSGSKVEPQNSIGLAEGRLEEDRLVQYSSAQEERKIEETARAPAREPSRLAGERKEAYGRFVMLTEAESEMLFRELGGRRLKTLIEYVDCREQAEACDDWVYVIRQAAADGIGDDNEHHGD